MQGTKDIAMDQTYFASHPKDGERLVEQANIQQIFRS